MGSTAWPTRQGRRCLTGHNINWPGAQAACHSKLVLLTPLTAEAVQELQPHNWMQPMQSNAAELAAAGSHAPTAANGMTHTFPQHPCTLPAQHDERHKPPTAGCIGLQPPPPPTHTPSYTPSLRCVTRHLPAQSTLYTENPNTPGWPSQGPRLLQHAHQLSAVTVELHGALGHR